MGLKSCNNCSDPDAVNDTAQLEASGVVPNDKSCLDLVREAVNTARSIHNDDPLGPHQACIHSLCERIQQAGFTLSIRSDTDPLEFQSSTDFYFHLVKWHLRAASGLNLMWDLVHELGHVILGQSSSHDLRSPVREREAWEEGWTFLISQCQELSTHRESFEARRNLCVATYEHEWSRQQ